MNPVNKFLTIFWILPITLFAQDDTGRDHPLISRFPGSEMVYYNQVKNGIYDYTLGPLVKTSADNDYRLTDIKRLEGIVTRIQYKINEDNISKIVNYYDQSLKSNGFEITAFTKAGKPMEVAGRTWALTVFKDLEFKEKSKITGTKSGVENRYYFAGNLRRLNSRAYVAMIINEFDRNEIYVHVDIITSETYPERRDVLSAELIAQNINEEGYAVIYGIYFEPNSIDIRQESDKALEELARYLNNNTGINLFVVGHTSGVGNLEHLKAISKSMAEAVINELETKYNINSERLIPEGVGPLSPVTSNHNLEGREINQRIELVLKSF